MADDFIEITVKSSGGKVLVAKLSAEDQHLARFGWRMNTSGYVVRSTRKKALVRDGRSCRTILLHREVLDLLDDTNLEVDHINGDKLDNRRENLETVTRSDNMRRVYAMANGKGPYICKACGLTNCYCPRDEA